MFFNIIKKNRLLRKIIGYKRNKYLRYSSDNIYDAIDFSRKVQLDLLNAFVENRIRNKLHNGKSLHIGFLVNERAKWNCNSLWKEIRNEDRMESRIYLTQSSISKKLDYANRRKAYLKEREFFLKIDNNLIDLYDWEKDIQKPVEEIYTDILFYQQPWGMNNYPRRMVGRALNVYIPYGFLLMANHGMHYHIGTFYPYLWKYFTQTEEHKFLHLNHDPYVYDKLIVTGYPKLDEYLKENATLANEIKTGNKGKKKIIFAPHFSFKNDDLKLATFEWSHKIILDYAKKMREIEWVYKPHPKLKFSVVENKIMTKDGYESYEQTWANLENAIIYDTGNYFDIFKSSDALITDCGSFLAEYLPTGKPIILLISKNRIRFNKIGEAMADSFYKVKNVDQFKDIFQKVIVEGDDLLEEKRREMANLLFPIKGRSSTAIVNYIKNYFNID